jgi:hypothetical protein
MPLTVEQRVRKATAARVDNARRRRFFRQADEMKAHPEALDEVAQLSLAEALTDCGWVVHVPA